MRTLEEWQAGQARIEAAWRAISQDVVTDGLPDWEKYACAPLRICYLLKEVNGGKSWDLCQFLREGGRPETWDNIARWTQGMFHLEQDYAWSELDEDTKSNEARRKAYLPQIAVVNLKKTAGASVADMKMVRMAAAQRENLELLREQLAFLGPNILVCCGTGDFYFKYLTDAKHHWNKAEHMSKEGVWYAWEGERLVIDYVHPAARVKDAFLYYPLVGAVREIADHCQPKWTQKIF